MSAELNIIFEYLNGKSYLKDVEKQLGISEYKINLIIENYKLPKLNPKKMTLEELKRMESSSCLANLEIHKLIKEQLNREKRIRVAEEISQEVTITKEKFLNSSLVNKSRIYGCD